MKNKHFIAIYKFNDSTHVQGSIDATVTYICHLQMPIDVCINRDDLIRERLD